MKRIKAFLTITLLSVAAMFGIIQFANAAPGPEPVVQQYKFSEYIYDNVLTSRVYTASGTVYVTPRNTFMPNWAMGELYIKGANTGGYITVTPQYSFNNVDFMDVRYVGLNMTTTQSMMFSYSLNVTATQDSMKYPLLGMYRRFKIDKTAPVTLTLISVFYR